MIIASYHGKDVALVSLPSCPVSFHDWRKVEVANSVAINEHEVILDQILRIRA